MAKLSQVLADRQQDFSETEKAQARSNIDAAASSDVGIKTVSHDTSMTGDGTLSSPLAVNNYSGLATQEWVESQGYSKGSATDLKAGRAISISNDTVSAPYVPLLDYKIVASGQTSPILSGEMSTHSNTFFIMPVTAEMGNLGNLYLLRSMPDTSTKAAYGISNSAEWTQVLQNGDNITANTLTVNGPGPDIEASTVIDYNGILFKYKAEDEDPDTGAATTFTSQCNINMYDVKFTDYKGRVFSLIGGVSHDDSLVGNGNAVSDLAIKNRQVYCAAEWTKDWGTNYACSSYADSFTKNFSTRSDVWIQTNSDKRPEIYNNSGKTLHVCVTLRVTPMVTAPIGQYMSTLSSSASTQVSSSDCFTDVNIYETSSLHFNCCSQWLYLRESDGTYFTPESSFSTRFVMTVEGYTEG